MTGSLNKLVAVLLVLSGACAVSRAQNANTVSTQESVVLKSLFQPVYPPVAKQARVTGDVELELEVKADGSFKSATVVSGHPLLKQAAVDSAQHSQFECRNCGAESVRFRILYSFQLGPTSYCTDASDAPKASEKRESYPNVTQSQNHITLVDQPIGTCDLAFIATKKRVRSIKCLFLWKCGSTDWHEEPPTAPR